MGRYSWKGLKNNVLNCQPQIKILQPRNQTFALAKLVEPCKMDLKSFRNLITFDKVPDAKHFQDKLYLAPNMFRFIVSNEEFEKYEQSSLLPPGLKIQRDFITEERELEMMKLIENSEPSNNLRNREVYHFGYDFNYDVNASTKKISPIPEIAEMPGYDQLTCNVYHPTEGNIRAHIDNTEAFGPDIAVISCNSDTVMEFKHSEDETDTFSVHVPRRSLMVMTEDSRYKYMHAIVARKKDYIDGKCCYRTESRMSFTYRKVTHLVPVVKLKSKPENQDLQKVETTQVRDVYNKIADDFSRTRYSMWPRVEEFINSLDKNTLVADVGCGNGKYLDALSEKRVTLGSDFSQGLINVCQDKKRKTQAGLLVSDCLVSPLRDNLFDAAISIAVIHHMTSFERRLQAFKELARVLKPGGRALATVWAFEQKNTNYVDKKNFENDKNSNSDDEDSQKVIPVHKARTEFKSSDLLVPWKLNGKTYHRFYHVFKKGEIEEILSKIKNVSIEKVFYDDGNWCVIFLKS